MRYNNHVITIFEKYVLKILAVTTCVTALSLTLIILLTQSIRYLELVISSDASIIYFLFMMALAIPKFLEAILPLAFTIGCIYTARRLLNDREIIIMNAAGASYFNIGRVFFIFAFIMMGVQFAISGWLSPLSVSELQQTRSVVKSHYATLMFREGVFNTLSNGLTAYVQKRKGLNEIENLIIHDSKGTLEDGKMTTILAKRGIVNLTNESQQLLVYDGTQYVRDTNTNMITRLDFTQYTLDIPIEKVTIEGRWKEPDERTFNQLFIDNNKSEAIDIRKKPEFIAEINKRISTPFLYVGYILCIIAFLFLSEWDRRSQIIPVVKASVVIILVQALHIIFYNEARDVVWLNLGMYVVAAIPILYGAYRLYSYHKIKGETV